MRTPSRGLPAPAAPALATSPRRMGRRYAKCDDPSDLAVASPHDVPWHRRRRGVPAPPAARPQHHRGRRRHRGRQGHPHRRRLRRGHHHHGRGGGPSGAAPARRGRSAHALVLHRGAGLRRQDQRHRHPRRPAARPRRRGLRRQRLGALGDGCAPRRAERPGRPPRRERRPAHRPGRRPRRGRLRRRRRRPGDRRRRATARCSPSSSAAAGPPRSSSTAGARPATPGRRCGRSGSARRATSPSARRPGTTP